MKKNWLFLLCLILVPEHYALDLIDGAELSGPKFLGNIALVTGDVWQQCPEKPKQKFVLGDPITENCFIVSSKSSYLRAILSDNSLIHLGENSAVEILSYKEKSYEFRIKQGQFRLLNFKKPKLIMVKGKSTVAHKGEFVWNLADELKGKDTFIVISGSASSGDKKIKASENSTLSKVLFNLEGSLWKKYFLGYKSSRLPTYTPVFTSRNIASADKPGDDEVSEMEEFLSDGEETVPDLPKVNSKILVHDMTFDAVSRAVEMASLKKANEIIPEAIKAACEELIWDVAHRSVIKWGTKYAFTAGVKEIPRSVGSNLKAVELETINLYDKELYKKSAEEITSIRSYRRAKNAAEVGGYNKGWREAQKYAVELMPEVVLPVVRRPIYLVAKTAGQSAAEFTLKSSKLLMTDDVNELVEHLSQVASKKIAMAQINHYTAYYTEMAAKRVALEIAKSSSEEIAKFVAAKASGVAGRIMQRKIAQKRARSIASSIATKNKKNEAAKAQSHSGRTIRETSR